MILAAFAGKAEIGPTCDRGQCRRGIYGFMDSIPIYRSCVAFAEETMRDGRAAGTGASIGLGNELLCEEPV